MKRIAFFLILFCLFISSCFLSAQQVIITDDAQYALPASGAMLDVNSTSKGFMPPRVALVSLTDAVTIASPSKGLMVYNTGTGGLTDAGIYYWNGTIWTKPIIGGEDGVDYLSIATNGTVTLHGSATTWNDLSINPIMAKNNGGTTPGFAVFVSPRVSTWTFDHGSQQELSFTVQLPHDYLEGSAIFPHVHWSTITGAGAGRVKWGMDYQWVNHSESYNAVSTLNATGNVIAGSIGRSLNAYEHTITAIPLGGIDGTGKSISSILTCRLYRDGNDNTLDTYTGTAFLLSIDFHYQTDSFGSRGPYTKDSE